MKQTIKVADKPTADEIKFTVESNAEKLDGIAQSLESGGMLSDPSLGLAALKQSLDELKNYVGNGKRDVANAITAKGIPTATDANFATLVQNIDSIVTLMAGTQDATAEAAHILSGTSAYVKGAKINGAMPNRGAVSQSLGVNGSYTIPQGYHNGSGAVSQSVPTQGTQTIMPKSYAQSIPAGRYLTGQQTIAGDGNLVPGNIKQGVSIFGVAGNFMGGLPPQFKVEQFDCVSTSPTSFNIPGLARDFSLHSYEQYMAFATIIIPLWFSTNSSEKNNIIDTNADKAVHVLTMTVGGFKSSSTPSVSHCSINSDSLGCNFNMTGRNYDYNYGQGFGIHADGNNGVCAVYTNRSTMDRQYNRVAGKKAFLIYDQGY